MRKYRLQDMSSAEFAEVIKQKTVVILPFGSQETHGPHCPMGDFVVTQRLAELAAERAEAVVAPTLPFAEAEFERGLAGTISLRPQTVVAVIIDVCESFLDHGVDRLLILNGQFQNGPWIDQATREIRRRHGVVVPSIDIWQILTEDQLTEIYGDKLAAVGHGGDPQTSMFLSLFPELMRLDLATPPAPPKSAFGLKTSGNGVAFRGASVRIPSITTDRSDNGVLTGDATLASADFGRRRTECIVDFTTAFIAHFKNCDPRSLAAPPRRFDDLRSGSYASDVDI